MKKGNVVQLHLLILLLLVIIFWVIIIVLSAYYLYCGTEYRFYTDGNLKLRLPGI